MAGSKQSGPICQVEHPVSVDDGTMCLMPSSSPGPVESAAAAAIASPAAPETISESPLSGSAVLTGNGMASVARIPVPGTNGLFLELTPRGRIPRGGSTSTVFIQDLAGRRQLRLDYVYNPTTNSVNYHWNQEGTYREFGVTDHSVVGAGEEALFKGAKYFRYGGRLLLVAGAALDIYSIVVARRRLRQIARVVAGWAGAWAGCEAVGAAGTLAGTFVEPGLGTAVGGFLGCAAGGIGGYAGASWAAGHAYDWVEETFFEPLPEASGPE